MHIFSKTTKHFVKCKARMPRNNVIEQRRVDGSAQPEVSGDWNLWGPKGQHPICDGYGLRLRGADM